MKILCIGNSFSQDACSYLSRIAENEKIELTTFNLYIGGCSLYTHFKHFCSDAKAHALEVNGVYTGFFVSIKEALLTHEWDIVTIQQASIHSVNYESYQPYLNVLADAIRKYAPKAKLVIHETWAYEEGSIKLTNLGFEKQIDMYNALHQAYTNAAKDINADFVIPSGTLFQNLLKNGVTRLHRDGCHVSLDIGRYALGLLWYKLATGNSVFNNTFDKYDGEITDTEKEIITKTVEEFKL